MPIYVDIFQKCCIPWLRQELLGHDLGRLGKYELVPKIKKNPFFWVYKKNTKKYKVQKLHFIFGVSHTNFCFFFFLVIGVAETSKFHC